MTKTTAEKLDNRRRDMRRRERLKSAFDILGSEVALKGKTKRDVLFAAIEKIRNLKTQLNSRAEPVQVKAEPPLPCSPHQQVNSMLRQLVKNMPATGNSFPCVDPMFAQSTVLEQATHFLRKTPFLGTKHPLEDMWTSLAQTCHFGVVVCDATGTIRGCSKSWANAFGTTVELLTGTKFRSLVTAKSASSLAATMATLRRHDQPVTFGRNEFLFRHSEEAVNTVCSSIIQVNQGPMRTDLFLESCPAHTKPALAPASLFVCVMELPSSGPGSYTSLEQVNRLVSLMLPPSLMASAAQPLSMCEQQSQPQHVQQINVDSFDEGASSPYSDYSSDSHSSMPPSPADQFFDRLTDSDPSGENLLDDFADLKKEFDF